jgi:hypothetical protein
MVAAIELILPLEKTQKGFVFEMIDVDVHGAFYRERK